MRRSSLVGQSVGCRARLNNSLSGYPGTLPKPERDIDDPINTVFRQTWLLLDFGKPRSCLSCTVSDATRSAETSRHLAGITLPGYFMVPYLPCSILHVMHVVMGSNWVHYHHGKCCTPCHGTDQKQLCAIRQPNSTSQETPKDLRRAHPDLVDHILNKAKRQR